MAHVQQAGKGSRREIKAMRGKSKSAPVVEGDAERDQPFVESDHDTIDLDARHRLISEGAYHLYAERGYADGHDLDDWLRAEAAVDHRLNDSRSPPPY